MFLGVKFPNRGHYDTSNIHLTVHRPTTVRKSLLIIVSHNKIWPMTCIHLYLPSFFSPCYINTSPLVLWSTQSTFIYISIFNNTNNFDVTKIIQNKSKLHLQFCHPRTENFYSFVVLLFYQKTFWSLSLRCWIDKIYSSSILGTYGLLFQIFSLSHTLLYKRNEYAQ